MQKNKTVGVLGVLLTSLALAPAVDATVITTGYIEVTSTFTGGFTFDFMIGSIPVWGDSDEGSKYFRPLYEGETFVGNHDTSYPSDMFNGHVAGETVEWRNGLYPFTTSFNTIAAGSVLTAGQTVYTSTFDFEGRLCGRKRQDPQCFVAFPNLTGQGIAEFLFEESVLEDGRHLFTMINAKYTFMPVPEPGTLALFGIGFTGIAFARRRRQDTRFVDRIVRQQ